MVTPLKTLLHYMPWTNQKGSGERGLWKAVGQGWGAVFPWMPAERPFPAEPAAHVLRETRSGSREKHGEKLTDPGAAGNTAPPVSYSPGTQQQFNRWTQSCQQDLQAYQQFDQQAFQQQSPFHDYRDHTQYDSDSRDHNKSVQVESEEEEPVRPIGNKAIGKKTPAKRWTDEEEVALAKSWLTISENHEVGNAQKRDGFYRKVTDHFHQLMKDNSRTLD
ncbi:hypothetical protein R6Q57_029869 [Mikania cordata]